MIFMQSKTTIHAIFLDWYDCPIVSTAYTMGIFFFITRNKSAHHFMKDSIIINYTVTLNAMKLSLFTSENGRFPSYRIITKEASEFDIMYELVNNSIAWYYIYIDTYI